MKRALILTNHLYMWAGSEIFALELGGELVRRGIDTTIFANDLDSRFALNSVEGAGLKLETDPKAIRIEDADFVYCQHQVLTLFLDQLLSAKTLPFIAYGHLSPYEPIEAPGPCVEAAFGNVVLCNSWETRDAMASLGLEESKLVVFPNPAPDEFFSVPPRNGPLRKLLAVSNHFPDELVIALAAIERRGVTVTRIGRDFEARRITASEIVDHDAVISIGKTVQYALAAGRPTFVYDRFNGPGWLTEDNFDAAAKANFSGRCSDRPRSATELTDDILEGYGAALNTIGTLDTEQFRLSTHVGKLLNRASGGSRTSVADIAPDQANAMRREREIIRASQAYRSEARRPGALEAEVVKLGARHAVIRAATRLGVKYGPNATRASLKEVLNKMNALRKNG